MIKPLNLDALVDRYLHRSWQRFIAHQAEHLITPFLWERPADKNNESGKRIQVETLSAFDARFDRFWERVRDKYPVIAVRKRDFLTWRFASISNRDYQILIAQGEGQMLGYIVLRCARIRDLKVGLIMDFLVADGSLAEAGGLALLAEAETYFRAQDMAMMAGLMMPQTGEYRLLHEAGLKRLPDSVTPRVFYFAFVRHRDDDPVLTTLSTQDWFVTLADYESF